MRSALAAAAAFIFFGSLLSGGAPAAALTLDQSCLWQETAADAAEAGPARRFLERSPGYAVTTCRGDRGVSHQIASPVRIDGGVCRMSVWRFTDAALAAAPPGEPILAPAFSFMATPEAGECPQRGKGGWIAATGAEPEAFARLSRFAAELAGGGRSTSRDRGCRKREDKLRRLVARHALISVQRETGETYALRLLRSGMGYTVSVSLSADRPCVRGFAQFIL